MQRTVRFFPNRAEFKEPTGAVKVNENLRLNLMFSRPTNPNEVYLCLTKDGESQVKYSMTFVTVNHNGMAEYTINLGVTSSGLYTYHFEIFTEKEIFHIGADEDLNAMLGKGREWQLTVYEDVYQTPKWLEGGIIYQILPDRFFIGGERIKSKDGVVYRDDWGGTPEYKPDKDGYILNNDFFGGNLLGITKKLGYLKSLGVTCIYLNPIFEAHSNHKYDTGNYLKVDPDFGNMEDLKILIKRAAKKDITVILDGVFSHTGDDSIYFNKYHRYDSIGAYDGAKSPYYDWYRFGENKDDYDCWWNIKILPTLNKDNAVYDEFINGEEGVIRNYMRMGLGGWRLDVADELSDSFLNRAVHAAKSVKSDALVLGEVWEDASNKIAYGKRRKYFNGRQLDSVTNYPFKEDIINFVRCGDSVRLNNTINHIINNYPKKSLDCLMNMLDTHDTARILSVLGDSGDTSSRNKRALAKVKNLDETVRLVKLATVLQYTLPGVPCVYYGDEAGLEGFEDPFNRRCFPWENRNKELLRWYKKLGAIRMCERAILSDGVYRKLVCEDGIIAYSRANEVEKLYAIVNNTGRPYKFEHDDLTDEPYIDLITNKLFKGIVAAKNAVIIKRAADILPPPPKK